MPATMGSKNMRARDTRYLVFVRAEIFKVSEAAVREADNYCDDQCYKREHGGRSWEACIGGKGKNDVALLKRIAAQYCK